MLGARVSDSKSFICKYYPLKELGLVACSLGRSRPEGQWNLLHLRGLKPPALSVSKPEAPSVVIAFPALFDPSIESMR